ncbi:MAG: hypothetical protein MUC43_10735 [Pirellula sp.]|jgi:hypothetical protein|nr:hypothetical protein [Pirellula sp.]
MNPKITKMAIEKLAVKSNSDTVALKLRMTTLLSHEQHEQLKQWGGKLLYDSGIVAVIEVPAGHVDDLAAWDNVLDII